MYKILIFFLFIFALNSEAGERLEIIQIGNPILRQEAREISQGAITDPEFQKLIDNMIFTMKKAGGVGLAAPQVNNSIRLFVMKSWPGVPLTIMINPRIEYLEEFGKKKSREGCLSIPGRSLSVQRFKKIHITYFDRYGEYVAQELSGFGAVIAQHEYDHLNGVLIVDLIDQLNEVMDFTGNSGAPLM